MTFVKFDGRSYSFPRYNDDTLADMSPIERSEYRRQQDLWDFGEGDTALDSLLAEAKQNFELANF